MRRVNKLLPTLISLTFLYLSIRLIGLGTDILNSDGPLWYKRSSNFLEALKEGKPEDTYQHYQPGVTLMWIRGLVENTTFAVQKKFEMNYWYLDNYVFFTHMHTVTKITLVFVLYLLFLYLIFITTKIFDLRIAVIFGVLLSLEPYLAGIDRWFHLTSLETYLSFSAFLTILYWYKSNSGNKKAQTRFIVITAILLGLSVLSKVTGLVTFFPILFVIFLKSLWNRSYSYFLVNTGLLLTIFLLTVFILFPALWKNPLFVLQSIFAAINSATNITPGFSLIKIINNFFYYPNILIYKLSPVTLFIFLFSVVHFLRNKKDLFINEFLYIGIYFLSFFLSLSMASKKIDRYSIELFFPVLLIMSIYISKLKNKVLINVAVCVTLFSLYSYINNFPVLSGYYSSLFGGESEAISRSYYDNSGEYFAQAALYLNNYKETKVYIPNNFGSFKYLSKHDILLNPDGAEYFLYSLDTKRHEIPYPSCGPLEKVFGPRYDKPVVYLYKCEQ